MRRRLRRVREKEEVVRAEAVHMALAGEVMDREVEAMASEAELKALGRLRPHTMECQRSRLLSIRSFLSASC